jgi:hypothetical protein
MSMSTETHDPQNREGDDFDKPGLGEPSARWQVCEWLRANGINPNHVPAYPNASMADGRLTLRMKVRGPKGGDVIEPEGGDVLMETRTFPITVPPPPLVEIWLAPTCPTCGR